jgi:uncharacterized protein DUF4328/uncharacterized protein DUF2510
MSDEQSGYPGAPPGWYPDPAGGPGQRWWDGYAWTDAVVMPTSPPPPPTTQHWAAPGYGRGYDATAGVPLTQWAPTPSNPAGLVDRELWITPIGRWALAFPALYYLCLILFFRVYSSQFRNIGHQYRVVMDAARNGQQNLPHINIPQFGGPMLTVVNLVDLCTLAAVIVACIWQFRAAQSARSLGFPAHHSPGWGVAFWFIPIVSLWMPYQAIRDCLPPDDPHRPLVLHYWLSLLGMEIVSVAVAIVSLLSPSTALVLSIPALLLCLSVVATAPRVVAAIASAHRAALAV